MPAVPSVPVPQTSSGTATSITVDYQEFGVRLKFTPVILGDGRIRQKVNPEVSDLDFAKGITKQGFKNPLINSRQVQTTVELSEGQTLAIAGLLNHTSAASINAVPVIGEMPVIGPLFRSVSYQRNETELLVLVTPRLVNGLNPKEVPIMPGEHWLPSNRGTIIPERRPRRSRSQRPNVRRPGWFPTRCD